ncbi:MAG: hypothetical protein IJT09_06575, partial [Abditibacteriota bacterium]|nr:hypothetical protein [Abditibacteriota bacterium]
SAKEYREAVTKLKKGKDWEISNTKAEVFRHNAINTHAKDLDDAKKAEEAAKNAKDQADKLNQQLQNGMGGAGAPPSSPKPPKYEQQKQNTLDKIAKDTGAMRKRMELSESNMELIRKLATRQIVAKGTSAKIQIVNNNNISNMGDAKAVVQMLTSQISEAAAVGAAGG